MIGIDIFGLSQKVLGIIQAQGHSGFPFIDSICYISHYNSRSRDRRVNTQLIDGSSQRGTHFCN